MAAKSRTVKWQKLRDIETKKKYSGETSPYWKWVEANMYPSDDGRMTEPALANPDSLGEQIPIPENVTRKILKTALAKIKFSKQEAAILNLLAGGLTQEDVAKRIGTSRNRVMQAILRIQKKGEKFLGNKLAHGSLLSRAEEEIE